MALKHLLAGAALTLAVAGSGVARANLLVNGSFETGDLTGWTSNSPYGLNPFGTTYGSGMDGIYWDWLGGRDTLDLTTSQTVSGLTVGQNYTLTFIMATELSTGGRSLRVSVNGGPGTIFTATTETVGCCWNNNWESKTYNFTAASSTDTIQFDTIGLGSNASPYDLGLDKVDLEASSGVPESATWLMMLVGVGGLGAMMRRRRSASVAAA